jgi:hypothetical protein
VARRVHSTGEPVRALVLSSFLVVACNPTIARVIPVDRDNARSLLRSHEHAHPAKDLAAAGPHDVVRVRVQYEANESIPGEGVVHTRPHKPMMIAGGILLGLGLAAITASLACLDARSDPLLPSGPGVCAFFIDVSSALLLVGPGIGLLATGANVVPHVVTRPSALRITPILAHDAVGIRLGVSF